MPRFAIGTRDFELDGHPHRILSGALHYFRIHPEQWADRIRKARQMGLNTIETYVAWNAHEPVRGEWSADHGLDLGRFLDLIAAEGMHAIVRPGPYICAEWDNGGLPAWLFRDSDVGVRRNEPRYLAAVSEYLRRVYEIVAPRQIERGGPVILVQIENEYGAYGSDEDYLTALVDVTRASGITVPLTTIDQPTPEMLSAGNIPGLHMTGSFGSRAEERLATLRSSQPTGPLMCMEFWCGWFDDWGGHHHRTDAAAAAAELDALLAAGASVNIYMFHGGTNFGLTNGANDKGRYHPISTSYDYDAPLDEAGHPTPKYFAFRDVIAKYAPIPDEQPPVRRTSLEIRGSLAYRAGLADILASLGEQTEHETVPTFDDLDHHTGLLHLTTRVDQPGAATLVIGEEVRDRAWVSVDGTPLGVLARDHHERALRIPDAQGELSILIEDQGRVNYGPRIGEHKGLIGGVSLEGQSVTGWKARPLHLDRVPTLPLPAPRTKRPDAGPAVWTGEFELDDPQDLYLDTAEWGKGFVWMNGFLLGRYWRRGPQRSLFIPQPVVHVGTNHLIVFELETFASPHMRFLRGPELGHDEH